MEWIKRKYRLGKWALIGNDYVWPRVSNRFAKSKLADMSASLVYERYIPFSAPQLEVEVEAIEKSGAEAVLISLIGQDAVDFNRIFGHLELDRKNRPTLLCNRREWIVGERSRKPEEAFLLFVLFRRTCDRSERLLPGILPQLPWRQRTRARRARPIDLRGHVHFLASLMGDGRNDWRERCVSPSRACHPSQCSPSRATFRIPIAVLSLSWLVPTVFSTG